MTHITPERWQRIKGIFDEALERDAAEQRAYVAAECQGDDDLRQQVETLLADDARVDDFLEKPIIPLRRVRLSAMRHVVASGRPSSGRFQGEHSRPLVHSAEKETIRLLAPGTRLGPYEILALAGHGGMGEVYRARDTRLGRQVAIKVVGASLCDDPDAERRFDDEARLAARLDHPRICAVHDVGQHEGIRYVVMEFLEGESLASHLRNGPLPIAELVAHAIEIASALAYAHRHHIVHRDIKPANILLTPSGVKVVDFGLARMRQFSRERSSNDSRLIPLASPRTRPGMVYGTAEYMSPERLEGRETDHRSDVFAFGAVLYEMATGRRAFDAPTSAGVIAAVMSSQPPPLIEYGAAMPELEWVIRRCLQKKPDDRWESMSDIEAVLRQIASAGAGAPSPGVQRASPSVRRDSGTPYTRANIVTWMLVTALACVALGASALWLSPSRTPPAAVVRFTIPVQPRPTVEFGAAFSSRLAISRDGRRLAYVARGGETPAIYLHEMGSSSTSTIDGTEGATGVFFSPDAEQVGFFAAGKLKKVDLRGGPVSTICDVGEGAGATWGDDNTIVFAPSPVSALMRVPAAGGSPRPASVLQDGEVSHRWPEFLPGGDAILFAASRDVNNVTAARIVVESLRSGVRTDLIEGTYPRYVSSGHLVFARDASLFAMPFDAVRLRVRGGAQPIVTDLRMNSATGAALFAIAGDTLIYRATGVLPTERSMVWVSVNGKEEVVPLEPRPFLQPRLSPDGTRVAITVGSRGEDRDVWVYDFRQRALTRIAVGPGEDETPVWSPDGGRIALSMGQTGQPRAIAAALSSGGGQLTQLWSGRSAIHVSDWSPDGRALAWTEFNPVSGGEIRVGALDHSGPVRTLASGRWDARGAVFSPDGRWIAYTSNESGHDEVYVQPYPGPGSKSQLSMDGGQEPVWSRNGSTVYFRGRSRMMSVDVRTSPTFSASMPRTVFADTYLTDHRADRNYDVSADGTRFLMLKRARPLPPTELSVVLNWRTILRRPD